MKKTGSTLKNPNALQPSPELISIQPFMPIDPGDRERLKADIQETNEVRDPIKAYESAEGDLFILGGYNRWVIAKELNIKVPVDTYQGTPKEYRELVIADNLNRRHFTAEQKRQLITMFLKQDPGESNRTIAKKTGATDKTVKAVRTELETGAEIPHLKAVKGADGKTYKKQSNDKKNLKQSKAIDKHKTKKEAPAAQLKKKVGVIVRTIDDCLSDLHGQQRKQTISAIMEVIKKYK